MSNLLERKISRRALLGAALGISGGVATALGLVGCREKSQPGNPASIIGEEPTNTPSVNLSGTLIQEQPTPTQVVENQETIAPEETIQFGNWLLTLGYTGERGDPGPGLKYAFYGFEVKNLGNEIINSQILFTDDLLFTVEAGNSKYPIDDLFYSDLEGIHRRNTNREARSVPPGVSIFMEFYFVVPETQTDYLFEIVDRESGKILGKVRGMKELKFEK